MTLPEESSALLRGGQPRLLLAWGGSSGSLANPDKIPWLTSPVLCACDLVVILLLGGLLEAGVPETWLPEGAT